DLSLLQHLENLEELNVDSQEELDPRSLQHLAKLKHLQRLTLRFCRMDDTIMPYLGRLLELRELDLIYNDISDDGLRNLFNLKKLKKLEVDYMDKRRNLVKEILGPGN